MPTPNDRLAARLRMLRLGCFANVILLAVLVAVPVVFFGTLSRLVGGLQPADETAIRGVLTAQADAWNRGDLDGFMAGYWSDDALAFTSGDRVTRGWKATRDRYQTKYFAPDQKRGVLAFDELEVEGVSSSAALVRGKYALKKDGETDTGRFTLVFRRFPDGWKITSDHTSAECPR